VESTDTYTERAPVVANLSSSELELASKSLGAAADVDPLAHLERCIADITFESSEGVFITDAELVTLRVNNSFTRITGYSKRETIGFPSLILGDLYDDLLRDRCWNDEMLGRKKSGDIYTAKLRVKAVVDAHDRVTHYIATLNDLSAKKALQKKIAHLGFTDSLTGLKSRPALLISMQRAIDKCREQQTYAAILLIDIDDFKSHNVHSGHLAGDMLLQQSARRLRQVVGPSVSIVRLFADKFVIVLEDLGADTESAGVKGHHLAARVRSCFSDAFDINAAIVKISVSMGLCLIGPNDTISTDVLIDRAELVTYNAKQAGGDCMFSFEFGSMEHEA
jgi:diguanylate cyclase (GGDEF)-like protein/PAS domain S-box-containing protein